jgi:hypothetical protein
MFKKRLISRDPVLKNLNIELYWDGKLIDTNGDLFPKTSFSLETPIGEVVIWEKYDNSGSISFVNSAMCTGMHQRLVNEFINEKLDDSLGHHFYDTFISLNLPPKFVKFGDQNKTRFVTPREEITPPIKGSILNKLDKFFKTDIYKRILKKVVERRTEGEVKKLKAEKRKVNVKHSHKYFPPTSRTAESLFIVEGLSAMGSILQKRNPSKEGVYALKGKIKNARSLSDLADNKEILELMQILNLEPNSPNTTCPYQQIIIATDADCLHGDTKILTINGPKIISEILPGDKVMTHTGEYKNVERVLEKISDDYIEMSINGVIVKCTPDHEFPIFRKGEVILEKAKNIKNDDFILTKK